LTIFDKIENHFKAQTPFVVYRKPNENIISGFFQNSKEIFFTEDFTCSGFVFSPFDNKKKSILIPENESEFYQEKLILSSLSLNINKDLQADDSSKLHFTNLVEKILEGISKNQFQKVVASRREIQNVPNFKLVDTYKSILQNYKNAFGYIWYHPDIGLWLGATPETLLNITGTNFSTMSLAGTQLFKKIKDVSWQAKELEEQQLVTTFITSQINEIATNLKINKKETIKAGNLLHLRTKISGEILQKKSSLKQLINALHPTPAVCGFPRSQAKEFILNNENYNRSYYTGYLGELNLEDKIKKTKKSSIFVNLRCMEIKNKEAIIYVGGGITKESSILKEWEETVSKSEIMKLVL